MKHLYCPKFAMLSIALCFLATTANWRSANAHPMGNFSINHLSRLEARTDRISIDYRLDLAEIPALAERNEMDRDDNDKLTKAEQDNYKRTKSAALARNLKLSVNKKALSLRVVEMKMRWVRGAGGLSTLRLALRAVALLPTGAKGARRVEYSDNNFARRAGWKQIVAVAGPGVTLQKSNAPSTDNTRGLTVYPSSKTPPQRTTASFQIINKSKTAALSHEQSAIPSFQLIGTDMNLWSTPAAVWDDGRAAGSGNVQRRSPSFQLIGGKESASPTAEAADDGFISGDDELEPEPEADNSSTPQDAFTQSIAKSKLTPRLMLGGILLAFVFGALHALSPGHGKTMVAAYLVGERGTWRHAVLLGIVVTITHTLGVLLLGTAVWYASAIVEPERLYPILSTASGLMIFGVGIWLLQQRVLRLNSGSHSHGDHSHGDHEHHHGDHEHHHADHTQELDEAHTHGDHSHGTHSHGAHSHSHAPQGPITVRALIALGVSGGLVPCPSALIVLLSAIALHRIGYGLLLICVFSLGLASVLIAIGCAVVSAQGWISRRGTFQLPSAMSNLVQYLPVASAGAVTVIGILLTWRALGPILP